MFPCACVWLGIHALVLASRRMRHLALGAFPEETGAHSDHPAVDRGAGAALQPLES